MSRVKITREYGPFPGVERVHGVTYDGENVWFASGDQLNALDPGSGEIRRSIAVPAHAGSACDGKHLFQLAASHIQKIDLKSGRLVGTVPAPGDGGASGLAWGEGTLWVGQYREGRIYQVDPDTGAVLRTIPCKRFVTGVTWLDGSLWHGTWNGELSELCRVDAVTGALEEQIEMPMGVNISGLESDGRELFFAGGGKSGKVRVVAHKKSTGA